MIALRHDGLVKERRSVMVRGSALLRCCAVCVLLIMIVGAVLLLSGCRLTSGAVISSTGGRRAILAASALSGQQISNGNRDKTNSNTQNLLTTRPLCSITGLRSHLIPRLWGHSDQQGRQLDIGLLHPET